MDARIATPHRSRLPHRAFYGPVAGTGTLGQVLRYFGPRYRHISSPAYPSLSGPWLNRMKRKAMQKLGRGQTSNPVAKQRISTMPKYGDSVGFAGRIWITSTCIG